jgi:hypothetical protein
VGSFTVTNPSQSPMALPEAQAVEPQPHGRKGDETTSEGFPSLAFRSLLLTRVRYPCWLRKRSTAATATAGFGRSPWSLRLPHHLHPDLPYSPCCVSWCSDRGRAAGATEDGEHRQHSRTDLGGPARPATGGADSSLRCAPHIPAPQRWQTATAAREAHPVSTRQT